MSQRAPFNSDLIFSTLSKISDGMAIAYVDGTLAYVNPAFCKFTRLPAEQVTDLSLIDLLGSLRTPGFDDPAMAVRRVLKTGDPYEGELQFPDRQETLSLRIWLVQDQSTEMNKECQPQGLAVSVREITQSKELQQMKSDMISLMWHELKTPITSISGFSELLAADDQLPEQAKEFVTIIASESQRLTRMIDTFFSVSNLEGKDKQELIRIPVRLDDVVRKTIADLQPLAKEKGIRLIEQPGQRIPPVAADKSLISEALKNLVTHAIKFSPERTTVTVSTLLEAETVRVSVEDRGVGIPPEAREHMWEKFDRVPREGKDQDDESTSTRLSFVREAIEQHGGTVDLKLEVGCGSRFSFTIPRL